MSDQLKLPLIPHAIEREIVTQRQMDGYINATAMCTAAGKKFSHYLENKTTQAFIDALAFDARIPVVELIQMITGGAPHLRGAWVHPQVAINLAQWLSPKFAVQVTKWVYDWLSGGKKPEAGLPYHLRRYVKNMGNVPDGHFSVLTEMTLALIAPLEMAGYKLPEKLWPDISQGKMFARYLRDNLGAIRTMCRHTSMNLRTAEIPSGRKPIPINSSPLSESTSPKCGFQKRRWSTSRTKT